MLKLSTAIITKITFSVHLSKILINKECYPKSFVPRIASFRSFFAANCFPSAYSINGSKASVEIYIHL